ncbi:DNA polymerase III subunit gamma/tau [Clostridium tyrobutyricum]|uniref:DNA polymerase III subunit gamma/tau n=1 Tax=Clostridium tyrobutyricum TaxID=1519 RepID=UPI0011CC3E20|nr:DNA polymerase III subunit gamma/tau [Clostridium tyrobutyricum]
MLYNDFRPKQFKDVIGQGHITEIIKNQVAKHNISHAYIFSGTRGTGKTTTSKILVKAVNCLHPKDGEPCGKCEMCKKIEEGSCLDVIEMDAASKRRIDDMRNIISSLKYPTAEAKYRVIILDEVHMLTQEAVNAFLKTLEEPPKNTIFILATTDPQKLPATILSRCQRFNFRRVSIEDTYKRLKYIAGKSSIRIDDKSLILIAKVSDGGMRDAVSILDQVKDLDNVSYKEVSELLGTSSNENMFILAKSLMSKDIFKALNLVNTLDNQGIDFNMFVGDFIRFLRNLLMAKVMGENAFSSISMTDEDIIKLTKINCNKNILIKTIELFQSLSSRDRVSVELSIIKSLDIINLSSISKDEKTGIQSDPVKEKHTDVITSEIQLTNEGSVEKQISNTDSYKKSNDKNYDAEKLKNAITDAKNTLISKLKQNSKYKNIGIALENADIYFQVKGNSMTVNICPAVNEENLIKKGFYWIKKGFNQFCSLDNLNICIIKNTGDSKNGK